MSLSHIARINESTAKEHGGKGRMLQVPGFDLTRLRVEDIRDLISDGRDLQQFRQEVSSFAKLIPPDMGAEYRQQQMRKQADVMLEKWNDYQRLLTSSIRESFKEVSVEEIAKKALERR